MDIQSQQATPSDQQPAPQTPNHLVATINVNQLLPPNAPRKIKSAPSSITTYRKSSACKKLDLA